MIAGIESGAQRRIELLLGKENLDKIIHTRVIIFGVGGVGSWCAECLIRSGVRKITIVDADRVCVTNCNRQLMATMKTVGQVKVEALRNRLLEISPDAEVEALQKTYEPATAESFHLETYDFIIDAIDSLNEKADLIVRATNLPDKVTFFSSMGAALRTDPFQIRKAEFWKVKGDPLARALRKKFKQQNFKPARKFYCVYSEEKPMQNIGTSLSCEIDDSMCSEKEPNSNTRAIGMSVDAAPDSQHLEEFGQCTAKGRINGSLCHVTAIFGMSIAGMVINMLVDNIRQQLSTNGAR
jgi:tRNA A37 threonylcarbamoyladenosine dehydratase